MAQRDTQMQIHVSTRHGHLSTATQELISEKLEKLFRLHDRLTAVNVTVDLAHKDNPELEIRLSVERTEDFVATDRSTTLMASLDGALHKAEQQLRKHKERITHRRNNNRRQSFEGPPTDDETQE
jgi:putative sigma-54 modulation protein